MVSAKFHKSLLVALLALGLTNESQVNAWNPSGLEFFAASVMVGAAHGLANKLPEYLHYRAKKETSFKQSKTFCAITFVIANLTHLMLLVNLPKKIQQKDYFVPILLHGCGQALIESYDIKEGTMTNAPINCTLVLAAMKYFEE